MNSAVAKPKCFYASPMDEPGTETRKKTEEIINKVIRPALEDEYELIFPTETHKSGVITQEIFDHMNTDELVIFNLTGSNPNVYFEFGLRIQTGLPYLLIAEEGQKIPFDVAPQRKTPYEHSPKGFRELKKLLPEAARATIVDRDSKSKYADYLGVWLQILMNYEERPLAIMEIRYDEAAKEYSLYGTNYHKDSRAEDKYFSSEIVTEAKKHNGLFYVTHRSTEEIIGSGRIEFQSRKAIRNLTVADCCFTDKQSDSISLKKTKLIKCDKAFFDYLGIAEPDVISEIDILKNPKTKELIEQFCPGITINI